MADYYVNVNGKKVLASTLDSSLQKRLADSGIAEREIQRQQVDTSGDYAGTTGVRTDPAYREFVKADHTVVGDDGRTTTVPGRYAERYGVKPPPMPKKKKSKKKKLEEKEAKSDSELKFNVLTGPDKGEKEFSQLSPRQQEQFVRGADPLGLAKKGFIASSDSIHFKTKKRTKDPKTGKVTIKNVYSPTLERNYNDFLLTGDVGALNNYIAEIAKTKGAREAIKVRERFIKEGVKGTELELKHQAGGKGTRAIKKKKEAQDRRSAQLLKTGQAKLQTEKFGPLIKGQLGATFDQRFPTTLVEVQGPPDPRGAKVTYTVDGVEFATREQAEKFAKSREKTSTIIVPTLVPTTSPNLEGGPKLPLAKSIEDADKFLDEIEIKRQKFIGGIIPDSPLLSTSIGTFDPTAVPVQVARIGLQTIGAIENTKEQFVAPLFGAKPASPITFRSTTADEVVFPLKFGDEGIKVKTSDEIIGETRKFVKERGAPAFVGGLAATYGIGFENIGRNVAQLTGKVVSKIKTQKPILTPTIKPQQVKVFPEIKTQVPLTTKQIETAQGIMKRITTERELLKKISQPTTLSERKIPSLVPSQRDVRIFAEKPKQVKIDPSYKPRGRNEGGFKDLLERGKLVDFKETKIPLGKTVVREPKPIKTDFADQKFREFIARSGSTFERTPTSLGTGVGKKPSKIPRITFDRAEQEFKDFQNLITTKPFTSTRQSLGASVGKRPPKKQRVTFDRAEQEFRDFQNLINRPIFSSTKVTLGSGAASTTKTISKSKTDDILKTLTGKDFKKGTTRKFDDPKPSKDERIVGTGSSLQITKLKDETKQIIKPQIKKPTVALTQKKKTIKSKSPIPITISKESDALVPKGKSSPVISFFKPTATKKKKKRKQELGLSSLSADVIVETMLLSKQRPTFQSKQKSRAKISGLELTSITPKLKSGTKLSIGLKPKEKFKTLSQTRFKLRQTPKIKQDVITIPKLKPKVKPKLKQRVQQKERPKFPPTTPKLKLTTGQGPKLTTKQTFDVPPPIPTKLRLAAAPPPVRGKKKKKGKKKDANRDDFWGSTWESDIAGFRSKSADFVYGKKKTLELERKERKRMKLKGQIAEPFITNKPPIVLKTKRKKKDSKPTISLM